MNLKPPPASEPAADLSAAPLQPPPRVTAAEVLAWLSRKTPRVALALLSLAVLLGAGGMVWLLKTRVQTFQAILRALNQSREQNALVMNHYQALADLKTQDVNLFKEGMSGLAQSKKVLFEAGLSMEQEKRLLEKQWEIIATYVTVDATLRRVVIMRGDQPLESYRVNNVPLKSLGGVPAFMPHVTRVVSKERFAHPERGRSEMVNGKLQWEPPQVGTSVRSNALGEYVLFTSSRLILHGVPRKLEDHDAFPHLCLGLSFIAAQKLYQNSFVGTKILLPPYLRPLPPSSSAALDSTAQPSQKF